jgi:hypothetical protein
MMTAAFAVARAGRGASPLTVKFFPFNAMFLFPDRKSLTSGEVENPCAYFNGSFQSPVLFDGDHDHEIVDEIADLSAGLYLDRALGGDRHHRRLDRAAIAGGSVGARSRAPRSVHKQPEADRPWAS